MVGMLGIQVEMPADDSFDGYTEMTSPAKGGFTTRRTDVNNEHVRNSVEVIRKDE